MMRDDVRAIADRFGLEPDSPEMRFLAAVTAPDSLLQRYVAAMTKAFGQKEREQLQRDVRNKERRLRLRAARLGLVLEKSRRRGPQGTMYRVVEVPGMEIRFPVIDMETGINVCEEGMPLTEMEWYVGAREEYVRSRRWV